MKYRCKTHMIEVEVKGNVREYQLLWSGVPQCALFTLKELKEGEYGDCKIEVVK